MNSGEAELQNPKLIYGTSVITVEPDGILQSGGDEGDFGGFDIPDTALLSWKAGNMNCESKFLVMKTVDRVKNFYGSYVYFEINGSESKAYIDRDIMNENDPLLPLTQTGHKCSTKEIVDDSAN